MLRSGLTPQDDVDVDADDEEETAVNKLITHSVASSSTPPCAVKVNDEHLLELVIDRMLEEFPKGELPTEMDDLVLSDWWGHMTAQQRTDATRRVNDYALKHVVLPPPPVTPIWTPPDVVAALSNIQSSLLTTDLLTYKQSDEYTILSSTEKRRYTKVLKAYHSKLAQQRAAAGGRTDMPNTEPVPPGSSFTISFTPFGSPRPAYATTRLYDPPASPDINRTTPPGSPPYNDVMTPDDRRYQMAFMHNEKMAADEVRQKLLAEIRRREVADRLDNERAERLRVSDERAESQRVSDELAHSRRLAASLATEAAAVAPPPGPEGDEGYDSFMALAPNEASNVRAEDSSLQPGAHGDPATGKCSLFIR